MNNITFNKWLNLNGEVQNTEINLADFGLGNKYLVIFCFQSWCPGCHSAGFPSLEKLIQEFGHNNPNISFVAIQTVFEGFTSNGFDKLQETQKKYNLGIPFIQDEGSEMLQPQIMETFETGGTPWFLFISADKKLESSGFHTNLEKAIDYLKKQI